MSGAPATIEPEGTTIARARAAERYALANRIAAALTHLTDAELRQVAAYAEGIAEWGDGAIG